MNLSKLSTIFLVVLFKFSSTATAVSKSHKPNSTAIRYVRSKNVTSHLLGNVYCNTDTDCQATAGLNSKCYFNSCICDLGYTSVNGQCTQLSCDFNSDCTSVFYNTRCDYFSNTCVCDYDTYLDYYSQTCLDDDDYGSDGLYIGIPTGLVLFFLIIACIICCTRRRRRIAAIPTQVMIAPGSGPPPPPASMVAPAYQGSYQNPPYPVNANYQQAPPPPYNPTYAQQTGPGGYPVIGSKS